MYFLAEDIHSFDIFRHELDNALKRGNVAPAFTIFNNYQQRVYDRLTFLVDRIGQNFGDMRLDVEESLDVDREKAPWLTTEKELRELWRKQLKNEVLKRKLTGMPVEDIAKALGKRYRSQLNRTRLTNSEDAFRIYMNALTRIFDPHTQYFSPRMSENFKIQMSLSLEGIGAVLQSENEHTKVVRLVPAGPADKGKALMPGDRIIGVGQGADAEMVDVVGWRLDDVVQLIRGPKGTVVRLEILPAGMDDGYQPRTISIKRNTVKLEEQSARKSILDLDHDGRTYKIGVIEIPTFYLDFQAFHAGRSDYKSTTRDVHRLLRELTAARVDGIIVDLRDNGGGALQEANELTGLFIEKGPTVQVRKANGSISALLDEDPKIVYSGPLVVMVNRMSASAAEIFAGAIQDYRRGIITGTQTFGKGTVQSLLDLEYGQLKLTFANFYRISGKSTQHQGVHPDIAYPPIYDFNKIGESALPDALPWSTIRPARYKPLPPMKPLVNRIRVKHQNRSKTSPDFAYLIESIEDLKENRQQTQLPLDEETRRRLIDDREKHMLVIENKRRLAKGLAPLKELEDVDGETDEAAGNGEADKPKEPDPLLMETGRVLADFIALSAKK